MFSGSGDVDKWGGLEANLRALGAYFSGSPLVKLAADAHIKAKKSAKMLTTSLGILMCLTPKGLVLFADGKDRKNLLRFFKEGIGHWDVDTMKTFVQNRFW